MSTSTPDIEKRPCALHPEEETRLRCTECETPICPKCMVMYEAGFKCPRCAKSRPSHVTQIAPKQFLGALALAGFVYGWLHPWVMGIGFFRIFGIPVLSLLLAYWLGRGAGQLIQRLIGRKYGIKLTAGTVAASVLGLLLNPVMLLFLLEGVQVVLGALGAPVRGTSVALYLLGRGIMLLGPLLFVLGLGRVFRSL